MSSEFEVWLTEDNGNRFQLLDTFISLAYTRVLNSIGRLTLVMPSDFNIRIAKIDRKIEVWRKPSTGVQSFENAFFIRRPLTRTRADGVTNFRLHAPDLTELLSRRIIAYTAGSSQAEKSDFADDMMKEIVEENLGASAVAARDYTDAGLTIAGEVGLGPSLEKSFSRRNVLDTIKDLSDAAREAGTEVYFDVVQVQPAIGANNAVLEFRTYIDQRGQDRRVGIGGEPIQIGLEFGNLEFPDFEEDYSEEVNFVYAGGQGEGEDRLIQTASDDPRINISLWNRREIFRDARHQQNPASVLDTAESRLIQGRPKQRFSGELISIPGSEYGKDWGFGDRITVIYEGRQMEAMIRAVSVSLDQTGDESIRGLLEVTSVQG